MRFLTAWRLFPLDGGAGLRGQVEEDAVHALDLARDAVRDMLQQGEGDVLDGGGHGVPGVDGAQDDGPALGALAVRDADGLEVRNSGEVLPHLALQAVLRELFAQDGVRFAHSFEAVAGDRAQTSYAQTRTRERLTEDHAVGQTQRLAHDSDLVLEQQLDGLDQLELQILGQTAHVVVRLDAVGFEDIGIDGALCEELDAVELARFFLKDADELGADDLALLFGLGDAGELVEEAVDRVDIDEVRVHPVAEHLDDLLGLALAEQSVVNVDADELLADSLDQQGGDDRAVHAAGEGEENFLIADLSAELLDLLVDERLRERRGGDAFHGFGSDIS